MWGNHPNQIVQKSAGSTNWRHNGKQLTGSSGLYNVAKRPKVKQLEVSDHRCSTLQHRQGSDGYLSPTGIYDGLYDYGQRCLVYHLEAIRDIEIKLLELRFKYLTLGRLEEAVP
ncbi:unnamed protein product [Linum trigynum]|uniref:Uncharacterized protein n=1 Tax=Linum trigynum TaxID=586398 RepID=A0AAV2F453_9ROSI